jgi:hypothetical protein
MKTQVLVSSSVVRQRGRPSSFSREICEEICRRIAEGETLRAICAEPGMPDRSTCIRWLEANPEFRNQYAQAREDQADALADEMLDVARSATNQDANAKRVLIDTLKWRAGKLRPKVYGEKMAVVTEKPSDLSTLSSHETRERLADRFRAAGIDEKTITRLLGQMSPGEGNGQLPPRARARERHAIAP